AGPRPHSRALDDGGRHHAGVGAGARLRRLSAQAHRRGRIPPGGPALRGAVVSSRPAQGFPHFSRRHSLVMMTTPAKPPAPRRDGRGGTFVSPVCPRRTGVSTPRSAPHAHVPSRSLVATGNAPAGNLRGVRLHNRLGPGAGGLL